MKLFFQFTIQSNFVPFFLSKKLNQTNLFFNIYVNPTKSTFQIDHSITFQHIFSCIFRIWIRSCAIVTFQSNDFTNSKKFVLRSEDINKNLLFKLSIYWDSNEPFLPIHDWIIFCAIFTFQNKLIQTSLFFTLNITNKIYFPNWSFNHIPTHFLLQIRFWIISCAIFTFQSNDSTNSKKFVLQREDINKSLLFKLSI